jgi:hypothetical protein
MGDANTVFLGGFIFLWVLLLAAALAALVLSIWMIVDAAQRPDWQFQASGQSKVLWVVLGVVGIAVCQLAGIIAAPIYLLSVRKRLDAAVAPMYGAYPAGYGPPPGYPVAPGHPVPPPAGSWTPPGYGPPSASGYGAPGGYPPPGGSTAPSPYAPAAEPPPPSPSAGPTIGRPAEPGVAPPDRPGAHAAEPPAPRPGSNAGDDPAVDEPPQPSNDR